jgi:hypothetical protein
MVYIWSNPENHPDGLVGQYRYANSEDPFAFKDGVLVGDISQKPHIEFIGKVEELRKFDCLPNDTLLPLVSRKVQAILQGVCGDDLQLFDAVIDCEDAVVDDYAIVNVAKTVRALDRVRASVDLIPGTQSIMGFSFLAYNSQIMSDQGYEIARDADYLPHILVGDQLFSAFEDKVVTGVHLMTVNEYNSLL